MDEPATRQQLRFLLNGETVELTSVPPTLTLLEWLRRERALTGTKEGCAEGDCGACSVVIAEPAGDSLRYRTVNACIVFLATLDAKAVITVEYLSQFGSLHPVQRNLVDQHASQCGFCTPGIAMSLFARVQNRDDGPIEDTLAGNLCRCTGYGPILDAANAVDSDFALAMFEPQHQHMRAALAELKHTDHIALSHPDGLFFAPSSTSELATLLQQHPEATLLGGGTDVGLWVTKQHRSLPVVISTARLSGLDCVTRNAGWLEIGAACSYSDALDALSTLHPAFNSLVRRIGSRQIRNTGTVVGNIANGSPIGDMPPALIALGASVVLESTAGTREIALEDFFLDYGVQAIDAGEFVRAIQIPPLDSHAKVACYKISKRFEQDISAVSAGFYLTLDRDGVVSEARLAFGGMAATPRRATRTEAALRGNVFNESAVIAALPSLHADFTPLSDWRASKAYRQTVAGNLLRKFAREVATGSAVDLWPASSTAP